MLILTRRAQADETVYLVDKNTKEPVARISVLKLAGNQVSLGFDAGKNITISRNELLSDDEVKRIDRILCPHGTSNR